jgi:hypothetical protein
MTLALLTALLIVGVSVTTDGSQEQSRRDFLSVLQGAQTVSLKETNGQFELIVMKDIQLDHRIIAVEPDYIVLEDIAGITETRVPIYSIKSIRRVKKPGG